MYPVREQIRARQEAFSRVAAWSNEYRDLSPSGESRITQGGIWVTGEFFEMLGAQPVLGRVFTAEEDRPGCGAAAGGTGVVISPAFWQREFGGSRDAVGRMVTLDNHRLPVIGVTPPTFFGVEVGRSYDVALPVCLEPVFHGNESWSPQRTVWWLSVLGRLKPGWTPERASAHFAAISPGLFEATAPGNYDARSIDTRGRRAAALDPTTLREE